MARPREPIPSHAKMVFKGAIFEVWQWEQIMFDGSTATFERLKRPNTVQVVATMGEHIMIQEEQQPDSGAPFLSIHGGRVDATDADALAAAKRELREETGVESDDWELWQQEEPVGKIEWTVYTFVARHCRKAAEPHLDSGERISPRLVTFDEFLALADNESFFAREIVPDLLRARADAALKEALRQKFFGAHA